MQDLRIGVDVGGTNTDAVLMRGTDLIAATKSPTTEAVQDGIIAAISTIIDKGGVETSDIGLVAIGTTHFTNAFVQRKGLDKVGIVRIALPAAQALPPMAGWPDDLASAIGQRTTAIAGGFQYDGRVNIALDEKATAQAARLCRQDNIKSVALSALFAPVNDAMEQRAAEIIRNEHPDCTVTLSSRIGRIGLLERENAGILNASLATLARHTVTSFRNALKQLGIKAPFYISQNDGTLMNADFVTRYPVLTFASGPTNSIRGAAYLSGLKNALVADIGGTTSDIGILNKGFPRESSLMADIGGVRTNFRMPDIFALGLGGGSIVRPVAGNGVEIGPQSVGHRIVSQAMVFGGTVLTATDLAVAAGYAEIGDPGRVAGLDKALVQTGIDTIHRIIEDGVDRMKTNRDETPLVLVGGGSVLINRSLKGVSDIITTQSAGVANAIGASIARIGGEVDKVYSYDALGREAALDQAVGEAKTRAMAAGADDDTLEVTDIEELPLSYVPGGSVRLRVKVAGDLAVTRAN